MLPENPNDVIGTPHSDLPTWDGPQSFPDTCAIRCQEFILEQFSGQEIDETALVQVAHQNGWYTPGGGTPMEHVGNLLDLYGVATTRYDNATVGNLMTELAQGHKVIIGVDSGELWRENPIAEDIADLVFGDNQADHAVVVSGIDTSDPNNLKVIISDPGTGEAAATYPMDQFLDAWADSDFYMVATQEPAPPGMPEMANFDYELGYMPQCFTSEYENYLPDDPEVWGELGIDSPFIDSSSSDPFDFEIDTTPSLGDMASGMLDSIGAHWIADKLEEIQFESVMEDFDDEFPDL